ncbi:hypothetical protein NDU88_006532 [Pleurodeles waltl]|uniref:Uncharacterized protein n=1 Tax=Pleurodeles waltl TaxID=8319 RepID=A0AAV7X1J6_PLEWA|nr:hypothetical protein NDU88_006532 [Pleurodeles waltl]
MWVIEKSDPDKNIPSFESIKYKVVGLQIKAKSRNEEIKEVNDVDFKVGDCVRIRRPYKVKGSKYFQKTKVVQVSKHSVKVEDGKWWSKRKVARVDKGLDMLSFQSQDKGSEDHESDLGRVNNLQDGMMFYETGVVDDVNVIEQEDVLNHTQHETSSVAGNQDAVRDKIQDTVQDESPNRFLPKRVISKPKYFDDFVFY